jgi:hypothetical protein
MDCIEPGAVAEDQLFALACGESQPAAAIHVARCAACASFVSAYSTTDRRLARGLYRLECPSALTLGELALKLLTPDQALPVRMHLADCQHCGAELHALIEDTRGEPLADLMRAPSILRRIVAALAPAPGRSMSPAGVRGTAGGARAYQAEEVTVSLIDQAVSQGGARTYSLLGLIDVAGSASLQASEAALSKDAARVASAAVDDLGNFSFEPVQPGSYTLELRFPDRVIVLEMVDIGNVAT